MLITSQIKKKTNKQLTQGKGKALCVHLPYRGQLQIRAMIAEKDDSLENIVTSE